MATKYNYSISEDFPNEAVNSDDLWCEIDESSIATELSYIECSDDDCDIWFVSDLSGGDKTTLDGIVAAHQGDSVSCLHQYCNSMVVQPETAITEDASWQLLGGFLSDPEHCCAGDRSCLKIRVRSAVKTSGTQVQYRVIERDPSDDSSNIIMSAPHDVANTSQNWRADSFDTDVTLTRGLMEYRLEGRLNGATSASIRYVTMSIVSC